MKIAIIGTGYVGLVTGVCLMENGHDAWCVDISAERVAGILACKAPFHEPGLEPLIRKGLANGRFHCTTDLDLALDGAAVSILAVGTPQDQGGQIDLKSVREASSTLGRLLPGLGAYHVVTVKSTVIPGTVRNVVKPALEEASGMKVGEFGLCMNPEFLREGTAVEDFQQSDRIIIGEYDARSGDVLEEMYDFFPCPVVRTSLENAEMTKYASNALLATLVSFSNELGGLCESIPGTDIEVVMDGLQLDRRLMPIVDGQRITPQILSYLRTGIGFGGSCLPKDVNALRNLGGSLGQRLLLLDAVAKVNQNRPGQILRMVDKQINGIAGKTICVLGAAFKPGTSDLRDSPALPLIQGLLDAGALVRVWDDLAAGQLPEIFGDAVHTFDRLEPALDGADLVLITKADQSFRDLPWGTLCAGMRNKAIFDGRGILRGVKLPTDVQFLRIGHINSKIG